MQRAYTENLHLIMSWFSETMCLMPQSCRKKISQWLKENFITIVAMAAFLILIQIFDLFIAGSLFRVFGEKDALKKNKRLVGEDDAESDSEPEPDPDGGEQNYAFMDPDEDAPEPDYMTAGDANNMADQYNQNQNQGYQNQNQEPFHYNQNQNQEPFHYNQNQGYQNQNQGYQNQNQGYMPAGCATNMIYDQYNQNQNQGYQNQGYHGYQEASPHY